MKNRNADLLCTCASASPLPLIRTVNSIKDAMELASEDHRKVAEAAPPRRFPTNAADFDLSLNYLTSVTAEISIPSIDRPTRISVPCNGFQRPNG